MSYLTYFIRNLRSDLVGDFPLIIKMTAECVTGFGSLQNLNLTTTHHDVPTNAPSNHHEVAHELFRLQSYYVYARSHSNPSISGHSFT